ncbi:MAG: MBL fold metallo-hydrolase [Herpetosiphonaceae bacterium]|nr:MAG: MBL fold metallo-hydrolase [Herpetosiphonaceae bacterium]
MAVPRLSAISGRTSYLPGANNLGIVRTPDGGAVTVDAGIDKDRARDLRRALEAEEMPLRAIISTHHHADHIGGNDYLVRNLAAPIYAPPLEAALIEHPILEPMYLNHGATPPRALRNKWLLAAPAPVTGLIDGPQAEIAGLTFEVLPLPGHSPNQIGVALDGVCFLADGAFGPAILEKYGIPYAHDIPAQLRSLDLLAETDYAWYLPSHGELTPASGLGALIEANRTAIERVREALWAALEEPGDLPTLVERVRSRLAHSFATVAQYVLFQSALSAYLSWLESDGAAEVVLDQQCLVWRRM